MQKVRFVLASFLLPELIFAHLMFLRVGTAIHAALIIGDVLSVLGCSFVIVTWFVFKARATTLIFFPNQALVLLDLSSSYLLSGYEELCKQVNCVAVCNVCGARPARTHL